MYEIFPEGVFFEGRVGETNWENTSWFVVFQAVEEDVFNGRLKQAKTWSGSQQR